MKISCTLAGGVKEDHPGPVYCVAWSKDLHVVEEQDMDPSQNQSTDDNENEEGGDNESNKDNDCDKDSDDSDSAGGAGGDGDDSENTTNNKRSKLCRYMATCGKNHLTLYEVDEATPYSVSRSRKNSNNAQSETGSMCGFRARQAYVDVDKGEVFYSCLFVGRGVGSAYGFQSSLTNINPSSSSGEKGSSLNNKRKRPYPTSDDTKSDNHNNLAQMSKYDYDGPQLCCVAGARGIIKVIDTVRMSLLLTLSGHGNEIYDMSVCPTDSWLLISASKDESLRLWNVQNAQCIAIFAGHQGHRDAVLSVDWHPLGEMFVSGGMDESIKIWSVEGEEVKNAIESDKRGDDDFRTLYQQLPIFSSSMLHANYVDCVQFVGDLILSKSTMNSIALWKPYFTTDDDQDKGLGNKTNKGGSPTKKKSLSHSAKCSSEFLHLRDFECADCDVWYVRFGTNIDCTMLAIGNNKGDLRIFHMDSASQARFSNANSTSTVRQVSFSPDNKSIIIVCDDSTVWRWVIS